MSDEEPKCRGRDVELFYDPQSWPEARAICSGCPIMLKCRKEWANDPWAFAGGMTPEDRRKWARRFAPSKPTRAGTARPKVSKATQAEVVRLFDSGLGNNVISKRLGIGRSTVRNILLKNDRTRTVEERKALAATNWRLGSHGMLVQAGANASEVMRLVAEGRKVKEIAEETGLSEGHVYSIRRKKKEETEGDEAE